MNHTAKKTKYIRARDLKPGMRVKVEQLRYIYEVYVLLSDTTHSISYNGMTGIVQFIGKDITPEVSANRLKNNWMCYIRFFDERESFDLEEIHLIDECSEI